MRFALPLTCWMWGIHDSEMEPGQVFATLLLIAFCVPVDVLCWPMRVVGWLALLAWCGVSVEQRHRTFGHGRNEMRHPGFYSPGYYRCDECGEVDDWQHWRWRKGVRA